MAVFPTTIQFKAGTVERGATVHLKTVQEKLGNKRNVKRMDSHTRGLVRRFQAKNKLPITGQVDAATWAKMGL